MTLKINTKHGGYNRSKRGSLSKIKYIVVHYTGTKASAKNNCIYFGRGNRGASADYFIDKDGSIWEYNNPKSGYYTWHCGDGHGKYGITNANSIGIEVVSAGEAFTAAQKESLKALIKYLKSIYKGVKSAPVRHYDASRKKCPKPYVDVTKWNELKKIIAPTATATKKKATKKAAAKGTKYKVVAKSGLNVRKDARKTSAKVGAKKYGAKVTVLNTKTEGNRTWGRIGTQKWVCLKEGGKVYASKV